MRRQRRSYRVVFLLGGIAFAIVSFVAGSWLHALEGHVLSAQSSGGFSFHLLDLPREHPFTFFSWLLATVALMLLLGRLFDRQVELRTRLEALALTDGLTLVYNHRYLMQQLSREVKRSQRFRHRFALLMLDIDDFKQFNDSQGHLSGDDVLRMAAQTISWCVRDTDVVARYGGEEFVVVAPGADRQHAAALAERIRKRIQETSPLTVSIGVGAYPEDGATVDELLRAADAAMYLAKRAGKNCVSVGESPALPWRPGYTWAGTVVQDAGRLRNKRAPASEREQGELAAGVAGDR